MRTMQQLENDLARHEITRWANATAQAVEAGNADHAARFARRAMQAARELDEGEHGAELIAEPSLRLAERRWTDSQYTEAAKAAGGVLVIKRAA